MLNYKIANVLKYFDKSNDQIANEMQLAKQ